MYLADQGASVIKVEPLTGDGARRLSTTAFLGPNSPGFLVVNRNKRGIAVDLRDERGLKIAHRLLQEADVVLLNFRPGVAERMGLGYDTLRGMNPRLVYVAVTPFGERGEWAQRRGYDNAFRALSGQIGLEALEDGTPTPAGRTTADTAGAMALAFGIMVALYRREITGIGQRVDASMLGIALALQSVRLVKASADPAPKRQAPFAYTAHRCSDRRWLTMSVFEEEDWRALCGILGLEHLGTHDQFVASRSDPQMQKDIAQVLAGVFEMKPRDEWIRLLVAKDIAAAPILTPDEAMEYPHMLENHMFAEVEHPLAGRLRMFSPPVRLSEGPPSVRSPAPLLGQHTDEVLRELGYTPEEVAELKAGQVVK